MPVLVFNETSLYCIEDCVVKQWTKLLFCIRYRDRRLSDGINSIHFNTSHQLLLQVMKILVCVNTYVYFHYIGIHHQYDKLRLYSATSTYVFDCMNTDLKKDTRYVQETYDLSTPIFNFTYLRIWTRSWQCLMLTLLYLQDSVTIR